MSEPFCASSPEAALLSDSEFWDRVFNRDDPADFDPYEGEPGPVDIAPCPECGALTACGYDDEGRPMIHATEEEED